MVEFVHFMEAYSAAVCESFETCDWLEKLLLRAGTLDSGSSTTVGAGGGSILCYESG